MLLLSLLLACDPGKPVLDRADDTAADTDDSGRDTSDTSHDSGDTSPDSGDTSDDSGETADSEDTSPDADGDGYQASVDCDDDDPAVHPDAEEQCDGDDDDCDGRPDLVKVQVWHSDDDGDGYGHPAQTEETCAPPVGWVLDGTDCRPADPEAYPGASERCNNDDDDCDWEVDEDFELDGDGYISVECGGDDCDDTHADAHPGGTEVCEDGIDNDCDGRDAFCGFAGENELADAGGKVYAPGPNYDAGAHVDLGDMDGDGDDDLLIGAFYADGYSGGAYVVPGPVTGDASLDAVGYKLSSSSRTAGAGRSIGVGDVNADGLMDFAVGAPDTTCWEFIVFGPVTGDVALTAADIIYRGAADTETGHGSDLADVNGDGIEDAIIGAYEEPTGAPYAGTTYVIYGPLSAGTSSIDTVADARLIGDFREAYSGRYVRAGADLDGDGVGDMLLAAPYQTGSAPQSGGAYIVYGGVSGDYDLGSPDGKLVGEGSGDYASESIAMGDVNGDGLADVIAGSYNGSGARQGGSVYVVYGPAAGDRYLGDADVLIRGNVGGQYLGANVVARDLNGDGMDDLLAGANGDNTNGSNAGAAFLFFGPLAGSMTPDDAQAAWYGESAGDQVGLGLGMGDVNGDGQLDLAIGAPAESTGGANGGAVYVVYPAE